MGLPPTLGLAVMFLSLPALATFAYGAIAVFAGVLFSASTSSSSTDDFDFGETGAALGAIGAVLLAFGLIGIVSVVAMAAGSTAGRISCTIFCAISLALILIGVAFGGTSASLVTAPVSMAPPVFCLWAMWGGRSREIF